MAMSSGSNGDGPMSDINTTPLIDVMLVMLIMFIITLPPQTDAVPLDLPPPNHNPPPPKKPVVVDLAVASNGAIIWNGATVSESELRDYLKGINATPVDQQPEIHFAPDGNASYNDVARVLTDIKRNDKIKKLGFVGNDGFYGNI
jgi:biopolymer transport protein ExbD